MFLVTGGSGYIGSVICKELDSRNIAYNVLARRPKTKNSIAFDLHSGASDALLNILNAHSHIIHCAWFVKRDSYLNALENFDWVSATLRMAALMDPKHIKHLNALGTCLEYKPGPHLKTVSSELGADHIYSAAKLATLTGLQNLLAQTGVKLSWSRIFHIYGQDEHPAKLIPTIDRCVAQKQHYAFKSTDQIIDLSHISDVAKDIVEISLGERQGTFNVCSGRARTIKEIITERAGEDFCRQYFTFSNGNEMTNNLGGERFVKA